MRDLLEYSCKRMDGKTWIGSSRFVLNQLKEEGCDYPEYQMYEAYILHMEGEEEQAKEMETKEFSTTAGGGAVEVTVSGSKKILKVKLDEEVVDPDDVEMLEDLLVAAVNEALEKVDAETTSAMSKFTGGMGVGMPVLF